MQKQVAICAHSHSKCTILYVVAYIQVQPEQSTSTNLLVSNHQPVKFSSGGTWYLITWYFKINSSIDSKNLKPAAHIVDKHLKESTGSDMIKTQKMSNYC